jgi:hypothetical protein
MRSVLALAKPSPAELPNGAKPGLEKKTLGEWREKEQPADRDLLIALDEHRPWRGDESDLAFTSPEAPEGPADKVVRLDHRAPRDEREGKGLDAGEPARTNT